MFGELTKRLIGALFAIGFLLIFVGSYTYLLVVGVKQDPVPETADQKAAAEAKVEKITFQYIAGVAAGLVGTVVAMGMGIKPPDHEYRFDWKRLLALEWGSWQNSIALLYAVGYCGIGIASIAVLMIYDAKEIHPLIQSFGPLFFGFGLAVARGFFGIKTQSGEPAVK